MEEGILSSVPVEEPEAMANHKGSVAETSTHLAIQSSSNSNSQSNANSVGALTHSSHFVFSAESTTAESMTDPTQATSPLRTNPTPSHASSRKSFIDKLPSLRKSSKGSNISTKLREITRKR